LYNKFLPIKPNPKGKIMKADTKKGLDSLPEQFSNKGIAEEKMVEIGIDFIKNGISPFLIFSKLEDSNIPKSTIHNFAKILLELQIDEDSNDIEKIIELFEKFGTGYVSNEGIHQFLWLKTLLKAIKLNNISLAPELSSKKCPVHQNLKAIAKGNPDAFFVFEDDRFENIHNRVHLHATEIFASIKEGDYISAFRSYYGILEIYKLNIATISSLFIHNILSKLGENSELQNAIKKKDIKFKEFLESFYKDTSITLDGELKREKNFIEIVIENTPIPIFFKTEKGIYIGCNKEFLRFLGMEEKRDVIGKTVFDFLDYKSGLEHEKFEKKLLNNEIPSINYRTIFSKYGEKKYVTIFKLGGVQRV